MPRWLANLLGLVTVALLVIAPISYASRFQAQMRNFRVVCDGVLYRSGQMSVAGLKRIVYEYGIRTVISLRGKEKLSDPEDKEDAAEQEEERYCLKEEISFFRLPSRHWEAENPEDA